MEGGVAVGGGSIWVSHMLQQQLDNVCLSQTGGNVKGRLVLLWLKNKKVEQIRVKLGRVYEPCDREKCAYSRE